MMRVIGRLSSVAHLITVNELESRDDAGTWRVYCCGAGIRKKVVRRTEGGGGVGSAHTKGTCENFQVGSRSQDFQGYSDLAAD